MKTSPAPSESNDRNERPGRLRSLVANLRDDALVILDGQGWDKSGRTRNSVDLINDLCGYRQVVVEHEIREYVPGRTEYPYTDKIHMFFSKESPVPLDDGQIRNEIAIEVDLYEDFIYLIVYEYADLSTANYNFYIDKHDGTLLVVRDGMKAAISGTKADECFDMAVTKLARLQSDLHVRADMMRRERVVEQHASRAEAAALLGMTELMEDGPLAVPEIDPLAEQIAGMVEAQDLKEKKPRADRAIANRKVIDLDSPDASDREFAGAVGEKLSACINILRNF